MNNLSSVVGKLALRPEHLERGVELFKAMGDPTRLSLLCHLLDGEKSAGDLSRLVRSSSSAVSHQLRLLRSLHLVRCRRDGRSIIYSLADDHVGSLIEVAMVHIDEPRPADVSAAGDPAAGGTEEWE